MENILKVEDLSYWYDDNNAIFENVNIEFEKGKFYSIVGSSGSGKTTFLSLISGLEYQKEGRIIFKDKDTKKIGLENYRNKCVSIIFQGFNLLTYMTAIQNITSAMSIKGIKKENNKQYAIDMLKRVKLTEEQGKQKILTLSGGQQQRVAIARALCCESDVIIADEPTGNLDPDTAWEIMNLLNDINLRGTTVVVATHAKDIVDKMNKRVIRIDNGNIIRDEKGGYDSEI